MSWSITEQKPLAGVSMIGTTRVLIDLAEAFDEPPTFEQIARHVGISPERLLHDLVSVSPDQALWATKLFAQRVIFRAINPDGYADFRQLMDEDPETHPGRELESYVDRARRERILGYGQLRPNRQTDVFPFWLVPTTADGRSVVIPAPLSASTKNLIELRQLGWQSLHDHLETHREDFVELREQSERLYFASKAFIGLTRQLKAEAGALLQPLNDLATMIGNMLASTDPPLPHHGHAAAQERNRRVAAEVAADLHLGASLVTEHYFGSEDDRIGKRRADEFRIIKHCLEHFPGEAAARLLILDDLAPPEVMFEYFRAMEACAAALSVAEPEAARPLLEKHFMHALVSVAEAVDPIDLGGLDGVKKQLAEAVNAFDAGPLKALDKREDYPALAVTIGPPTDTIAKGKDILDWADKPASIVEKLANCALLSLEGSTFAKGTPSALMTRLALGLTGRRTVELIAVRYALLAQAAGENIGRDEALARALQSAAKKKVENAAQSVKDRLTITDDGVLLGLSSIRFFLDCAATMMLFSDAPDDEVGMRSAEWLRVAKQLHSTAGSAAKLLETIAARYGSAASHAAALEKEGIHRVAEWAKIADAKVLPVVEVALGLWSARETQLESMRWGHDSDAGFEVLVLVVGLVKYVHPLVGFVATAALGVIRILGDIDGGSNGMHAYYEHERQAIVEGIKGMAGMNAVAEKWRDKLEANNPTSDAKVAYDNWHKVLDIRNVKDATLSRMDRIFALVYQLNEWGGAMKPVSMPAFVVSRSDEARVRASLEEQKFPRGAIDLVLKR